ncbi:hypothetical protein PILCRDRAFT_10438 [Piloderma croceum F 1598]|uniref:Protein kinase domain-containing protein n=1 Tax=Piloderma croceum (strain F 1598) TaxID=765440 RepID=A0A0C3FHL5_PILCF|nr:hypothetical protein PILCRDRAFT_10438 [Piloderma croceum F 1598]
MPHSATNLVKTDHTKFEAPLNAISAMKISSPPQKCRYLQVQKIGKHYFAVGRRTDLWLGNMVTEDGGCEKVVLKRLRDGIIEKRPELKGQIIECLRQYFQVAHTFDHPHVGRVIGLSDINEPVPDLILPHFSNGDIVIYLKQAKDILAGLAYLHRRGIVHGSVHNKNVLVDDTGAVVLCDATFDSMMFGEDDYSTISSAWWWMPYERLIVDDDADDGCAVASPSKSADMYGAALTIAQMWTLRRPFYGMRDEYELIRALRQLKMGRSAQLDRPEEVLPNVWVRLQNCLSINPQVRPTAEVLLASFSEPLKMEKAGA